MNPPPPLEDLDSSSSEEEESDSDEEIATQQQPSPSDVPEKPLVLSVVQKRPHISSSSDSDKDAPPGSCSDLQVVSISPGPDGWVKVVNKKGKKFRIMHSTPSG